MQGPFSTACQSFFTLELAQNPPCARCLQTFDLDWTYSAALYPCVAPFVSASCNHDTGCVLDCEQHSCGSCAGDEAEEQCTAYLLGGGGPPSKVCTTSSAANDCVNQAIDQGPASFCNPSLYYGGVGSPTFGAWLQGVGTYYCGLPSSDGGTGGD
jgi:hypothetical protein